MFFQRWCWFVVVLTDISCYAAYTKPLLVSRETLKNYDNWEKAKENQSRAILFERLSRAFTAMIDNLDDVDVDAYFGVVLAKAQLEAAGNRDVENLAEILIKKGPTINHPLGSNVNNIARHILNPKKWKEIGKDITKTLDCKLKHNIDTMPKKLYSLRNSPNETESDMCLSQLIDEAELKMEIKNEASFKCEMSEECKDILLRGRSWSYALTHKVIYFLVAESQGCTKTSVEAFCCDIKKEILETEYYGFPSTVRDIFIEQVLVCALSGYGEFLRSSWIRRILNWQKKEGCWGTMTNTNNNDAQGLQELISFDGGRDKENGFRVIRNRRSTQPLGKDGCSSHMTGISVALLALSARHDVHIGTDSRLQTEY